MTRQKTLDRLLHLRILEEDGKIVGSGSGNNPTPSAQGQQPVNTPGLIPSPRNAPPVATTAAAAAAAAATTAVNPSPEPPLPPQLPLPPQPQPPHEQEEEEEEQQPLEKQTPTPRNNSYSNSYSSHSHTHKDINPPQPSYSMTRQGSFFNQPSPVFSSSSMRRAHDSTNSLAGSNYGSIHRKVNSGSVRGGGGRPPSLDEIRRSSSVIETSYQTTAVSQVKLDRTKGCVGSRDRLTRGIHLHRTNHAHYYSPSGGSRCWAPPCCACCCTWRWPWASTATGWRAGASCGPSTSRW